MKKVIQSTTSGLYLKLLQHEVPGVEIVPEYMFHPTRRWRFDYAIPSLKLAIEIDGGIHTGGRHVQAKGYIGDLQKFNEATALGWRILRIATDNQFSEEAMGWIRQSVKVIENERNGL